MRSAGIFEIEESFKISDRGIIILGVAKDFIPKIGMFISIMINEKTEVIRIKGTEISRNPNNFDYRRFGLLLELSAELEGYISENKIRNQNGEIFA